MMSYTKSNSVPHLLEVSVGEELLVIDFLPHSAESLFAYFDSRSGIVDKLTIGVKGEEQCYITSENNFTSTYYLF